MWQIVELKEKEESWEQYSVSAVGETWIKVISDSVFCYWPDTNAAHKIRTLAEPKAGGSWTLYECRVLMKGAKYSTYEEAKEAEKICENVSTMSGLQQAEEVETGCENLSTRQGRYPKRRRETGKVKEKKKINENKKKTKPNNDFRHLYKYFGPLQLKKASIDDCDSSSDDDCLPGIDSFKFNESLLKRGSSDGSDSEQIIYVEKLDSFKQPNEYPNTDTDTDIDSESESSSATSDENSAQEKFSKSLIHDESEYAEFKSNVGFLTSTALFDKINKSIPDDKGNILTRLNNLESIFLKFSDCVQREIREMKEIKISAEDVSKIEDRNIEIVDKFLVSDNSNGKIRNNLSEIPTLNDEDHDATVTPNFESISDTNVAFNKPTDEDHGKSFTSYFEPVNDFNTSFITYEKDTDTTYDLPPIGDNDVPEDIGLKLPILGIEEYEIVDTLHSEPHANYLKELTLPMEVEIEPRYMDRIFLLLFEKNFFLKHISWKKEKNRMDIKSSNILKCWRESHQKKFAEDIGNERFMKNCRRLKSALRAKKK